VILAWVISSLPPAAANSGTLHPLALGMIFLAGIFPETYLTYIRETVRPLTGKLLRVIEEEDPLTNLDGVDLYDRTRLLDEGVTNIESLAHHDFVDLMIETRIPVPRLVDWVDQSILYLHVRDKAERSYPDVRTRLRNYGIRTATDLLLVHKLSHGTELHTILQTLAGETDIDKVNRLQVIVEALSDDEWLKCVKHWRGNTSVKQVTLDAGTETRASFAVLAAAA